MIYCLTYKFKIARLEFLLINLHVNSSKQYAKMTHNLCQEVHLDSVRILPETPA